jgi:peptidoglycan/xylan/chitin deacetylase (PgdA/CDA1 family)
MSGASSLVYTLLARSGIAHALRRRDAAPIFCFHNVVNDAIAGRQGDPSLHIGLSPFKALLDLIVSQYTVIPLLELAARLRSGRSLRGTASLTFDDAYHGALTHAVPVLKRLALPATVFIVTDAADRPRPFWWDVIASTPADVRGNYLRDLLGDGNRILNQVSAPSASLGSELLPADWPTLHAMLDATVVPGSHTLTHRNLSALDADGLEQELRVSRQIVAERFGPSAVALAYPYGFASPEVVQASARAGFLAAVTLGFGRANRRHNPQSLPRINVPAQLPKATFECWGSGLRLRPAPIGLSADGLGTLPAGNDRGLAI